MATKTFTISKQLPAAYLNGGGVNNPGDSHLPIGMWDPGTGLNWVTRALLYAPISFSGMTAINSARLYFYIHTASGWHANGSGTRSFGTRRKSTDWSEASGGSSTAVDEIWGGSGGDTLVSTNRFDDGDGTSSINTDAADGTLVYIDITEAVKAWFGGAANYGLYVFAADESTAAAAFEGYSRHASGKQPYIWIDYATNTAPNAPTSLSPTADAVRHTGSSVTLTGTRSDPDSGDYITSYHVEVMNDALTTEYHDSYNPLTGTPTTFSKVVSGLPTNVFLRWRARTRDKDSVWGPFSAWQRFKLNSVPNQPTVSLQESPTTDVKTLTPTFNVTHSDPDSTDTKAYKYQIDLETSAGVAVWDTGEVTLGTPITTVSRLYNGPALSWGTAYRWRARTQDMNGAWSAFTAWQSFTTHKAGVPVSLSPSGGTVVGNLTPTFTGSRASSADSLTSAQVQVYSNDGVTLIWDSGVFTTGVTSTGFTKQYAGTTLAYATAYKWRARVTSSVGGESEWSSLQAFSTPAADAIQTTAPVGTGITDLTPDFTFSRTNSFNAYQIILYAADGTTVLWDSGTVTHAAVTSQVVTYPGTPALAWATTYQWKVRVSSDSGATWGNGYTSLVSFRTDEAGVPSLSAPAAGAWLGAPWGIERCDNIAGVTGNTYHTVTLDSVDYVEGSASWEIAVAAQPANMTYSAASRSILANLSNYGGKAKVKAQVKASSLTDVSYIAIRFVFATASDWAQYTVTPGVAGAWAEASVDKGSPNFTNGTIDWSNVTSVQVVVRSGASALTTTINVDNIRIDSTNPSFDGAATGGETISTARVQVYASDQTTLVWDSGEVAVSATSFAIAYAGSALTPGSTYYWTARYTENTGPTGGYAPLRPFVLNSAPGAPTALTPATGAVVADDLAPTFEATFTDVDLSTRGDTPSALEVEVYRNSDSVLMHVLRGTSLISGSNSLERTTEGTALTYEVEYKWRARYADSLGAYGAWSSYNVFKPSQSPTVTITAPISSVIAPSFNVVWTFSSPAAKAQNRYRVTITRDSDGVVVYDSGLIFSSVSSHTVPGGFLVNSTAYTIGVVAHDTDGLASAEDTEPITSSWAAPDSIAGFSVSALDETSEMLLVWNQSNLTASDFSYYQIYRREQGSGEWEKYARLTNQSTTEFSDFYAGHSVTYEYKITVWKKVAGDVDIESSDSEIPYAILDPDSWFFIGADRDPSHIFELPVYDESHTEPIQQEVFEPLGSRRKSIVRGKVLGSEGTLQVQWLDAERRNAQEQLRYLADNAGPHILKSPFGDVWLVEFSGPAKKYTGGGHLGVTLSWIEVQ